MTYILALTDTLRIVERTRKFISTFLTKEPNSLMEKIFMRTLNISIRNAFPIQEPNKKKK